MPCIFRDGKLALYFYADDHAPPHFHVRSPDSNAQVEIATLEIMRGSASRADLERAIAWSLANRAYLESKWRELNERD